MNNTMILYPMLGMMLLTFTVWLYLYTVRISAMQKAGVPAQAYTTPEKAQELLPESASYPSNNLKNLFELPVLFYALCLTLFVTGSVDAIYVAAAWGFLGFRAMHSLIHCTVNRVMARFLCYLVSSVLLWLMVIRAAIGLFSA